MQRDLVYLEDVILAADTIVEFIQGRNLELLIGSALLQSALAFQLTIIGEAVSRVSEDVRGRHPSIPDQGASKRHCASIPGNRLAGSRGRGDKPDSSAPSSDCRGARRRIPRRYPGIVMPCHMPAKNTHDREYCDVIARCWRFVIGGLFQQPIFGGASPRYCIN
jgi:hypothetical protein